MTTLECLLCEAAVCEQSSQLCSAHWYPQGIIIRCLHCGHELRGRKDLVLLIKTYASRFIARDHGVAIAMTSCPACDPKGARVRTIPFYLPATALPN